jgi:hypothetical protein
LEAVVDAALKREEEREVCEGFGSPAAVERGRMGLGAMGINRDDLGVRGICVG